ncbi:hypothetical protein GCM10009682_28460 [Luedemannella flava]|uniref:V-type ATPase, D subunit n=1 Tax=Luedemannella flava TaxID=349316 RepID=A0ABN2M0C9_9ACTN
MPDLRGVPPGRAGRLWLTARLHAAEHAAELLQRKLRLLGAERERLAAHLARAEARWRDAWRMAVTWSARAAALGGPRERRLSAPPVTATVTIAWQGPMGVRYPQLSACVPAIAADDTRAPGTAALLEAATAYRDALAAAAEHATTRAAVHVIDAEISATRRRVRAITDRRIATLTRILQDRIRDLDEEERAYAARLRWAADHRPLPG